MIQYESRIRGVAVGIGVAVLALLLAMFALVPGAIFDTTILTDPYEANRMALTTYMVFNFLAFVIGGALYLLITGRGWTFIDIVAPDRQDVKWMLGGTVLVLGFYILISIVATLLELPAADSDVVLLLGDDVTMIIVMMVIVVLFNAPAEEFLFRNVIQKRLYDSYSNIGAVLVTSVIFVLPHVPSYFTAESGALATAVSMFVLFGGSVIMGYAYLRTRNLLVPILIHAVMNLFMLLLYLIQILYDLDEEMAAASLIGMLL